MTGEITRLVYELSTLSGGTRTQVKTDREPWQVALRIPEKCPLCGKEEEGMHIPGPGWKSLQNLYTPHRNHRILIPDTCWENEKLRSLGGIETLVTAWQYALGEVKRTRPDGLFPTWIFSHVGYNAGQNFPHHHWHILEPAMEPEYFGLETNFGANACVIRKSNNFTTALYGIRAGQTFIVPRPYVNIFDDANALAELAGETIQLVELFNKKFGYPDYCLMLDFSFPDNWFVMYTPILNNWGGPEFLAPYRVTPYTLPWPHERTLEFLKS